MPPAGFEPAIPGSERPKTQASDRVATEIGLTFWRRIFFFLILAHTVYKMWIIQEPNKLELRQTAF